MVAHLRIKKNFEVAPFSIIKSRGNSDFERKQCSDRSVDRASRDYWFESCQRHFFLPFYTFVADFKNSPKSRWFRFNCHDTEPLYIQKKRYKYCFIT